jgi:hypothetical protein
MSTGSEFGSRSHNALLDENAGVPMLGWRFPK